MDSQKNETSLHMGMRRFGRLMFLLFAFLWVSVVPAKAENWERLGDAVSAGSSIYLTRYGTCSAGGVRKNIPIDTRKGFTLSFEYRVGDSVNQPRNGLMAVFSDSLVHVDKLAYASYGYWDHIGTSVKFYGVEFDTYGICPSNKALYESHVGILSGDRNSVYHLNTCSPSGKISDGNWHSVRIVYKGSTLSVYQDGKFLMSSRVTLPSLCYLGITSGTSYWGYQNHQVRKMSVSALNSVKISLNANGGSCPVSSQYVLSVAPSTLPTATRVGYSFKGWYTAAKGGTLVIPSKYYFKNGQRLYAQWKPRTYQLTFNANGGKTSTGKKTVTYANACGKLPTPTRTKGTFLGWYTAKNGGTKYTASTIYKTAGNKTLYAHWKMVKYKVKFNANGGKSSRSQVTVDYGSSIGTLPTASRSGYSFQGWYTKKSGGTKVSSSYKVKKATTLYAHWKKNSGGGSGGSGGSGGVICATCRGTGRCRNCDGSGIIYRYTSYGLIRSNCSSCIYGRCRICGGDGRL
ncbi:MAG: InlB B-repeat-containing protein [Lachnospiraceae bacterium]|nr:InlB B-repeat-containing protein [Lachnospiraceae bacterium]